MLVRSNARGAMWSDGIAFLNISSPDKNLMEVIYLLVSFVDRLDKPGSASGHPLHRSDVVVAFADRDSRPRLLEKEFPLKFYSTYHDAH